MSRWEDPGVEEQRLLAAIAEPTRFEIVRLLAASPRTIGELAERTGARQPQVTRHIQALSGAGLVAVHALGRRRVVALEHERLRELADRLAAIAVATPSDEALAQYARAIATEGAMVAAGETERTIELSIEVAAPAATVWRAWTDAEVVRRWWAPEHFVVAQATVEPWVGGRYEITLREGDGALHRAAGDVLALDPVRRLEVEVSPLGPDGVPLFRAVHEVTLEDRRTSTAVGLTVQLVGVGQEGAAAAAGVKLGWQQTLAGLRREAEA
jgi:uncharacterized protein YndB with AHSA1/START domain/DNA-binding transcriptional ArsR family regulator